MTDNPNLRYRDRATISNQDWEIDTAIAQLLREPAFRFMDRSRVLDAIVLAKLSVRPSEGREKVLVAARRYLSAG